MLTVLLLLELLLLLLLPTVAAAVLVVVVVLLPCRGVRAADLLSRLSFAISASGRAQDPAIDGGSTWALGVPWGQVSDLASGGPTSEVS